MNQQPPPPYPGTQPGYNPGYPPPNPQQMYPQQQPYPPQPGYPPQQPAYQQQWGPGGGPQQVQAPYNYGGNQQQQGVNYGGVYQQGPPPPNMAAAAGGYDSDVENSASAYNNAAAMGSSFGDKAIRRGFIKKVYGILSIQLLVTCGIIAIFIFPQGGTINRYVKENQWVYLTSFAVSIPLIIALACCEGVRRKSPLNIVLLGLFTLCEGFMLGTLSAFYQPDAVILAAGITAAVTIGLTLFSFQTKWDFTACGGMLCGCLVILMVAGIAMMFMPYNKYAAIGYASAGAFIFSMYIIYDTQLMMGGKKKYSLSPEEYIFAALNLYIDVINLFQYILMIIGASRSD